MTKLRTGLLSSRALWSALAWLGACSSQVVCRPDGITGGERCEQVGDYGDALITGGAAAGLWAAAGCTINGCEMPFRCNAKTKTCERMPCSETSNCPPGYVCNLDDNRCR